MKINEMTKMSELYEASEYKKYSLQDLVNRSMQIATTNEEYQDFVEYCKGFEHTIYAGSWSRPPRTVA